MLYISLAGHNNDFRTLIDSESVNAVEKCYVLNAENDNGLSPYSLDKDLNKYILVYTERIYL